MTERPATVADAATRLRARELSSVELTAACLGQADRLDARLGTYLTRFDEQALAAAARADAELATGIDRGPLHGIPVAVKDVVATAEGPTTAQSLAPLPGWERPWDAPVVGRLRRAGAVITGKTTTAEFALGFPDPDKPFPTPRNPWALDAWAGGSSSGTANGIVAGMFLAGIGSDTGGSIRMPAAFCGITGLLPTQGRVPMTGTVPLSPSLDRLGPLARTAADCATVLDALTDRRPDPPPPVTLDGVRVGVLREGQFPDGCDVGAGPCFDDAVAVLAGLGARVAEVTVRRYDQVVAATVLTMVTEGLAVHRANLAAHWDDYFASTRESLAYGAFVTGADYVAAQEARRKGCEALAAVFDEVDVVVSPATTIGAPTFERVAEVGAFAALQGVNLTYWNGVGNPAVAVPMGFTGDGLPLGLHVAGRLFDEAMVVQVAHAFQAVTDWHTRECPL